MGRAKKGKKVGYFGKQERFEMIEADKSQTSENHRTDHSEAFYLFN